ncbi:MAG: response regulator [Elusimicrobia bacterium]|nr:response regulator [Elusimicrobiota bacterium]
MSAAIKALVVDDEEADLRLHAELLRAEGCEVQTASGGEAACRLIAKEVFDLIVTDIVMRPVSGFEVLQAARRADPDTISIAMTSFGSVDSAVDALNFGAYSYLLKPCDEQAFRHCVLKGLEKQRLVKELRQRNKELETINRELDSRVQAATEELRTLNHRMLTEMASLREVDELKTAFLNNVSHDLKNPLTTIKGYLACILEGETGALSAEVKNFLLMVSKSATHMEYLVAQLLEAARLTSGTLRLDCSSFSVPELVKECADAARVQADGAGVALDVQSEPTLMLTADRGRVLQILGNLLGNACKFTPRGGRISLSARKAEEGVLFRVADTGPGIAAEHLPRIFDRFYQVDTSLSKATKGLGLGLRIAKDLVELHGGKIRADSVPGQGSSFYVELPLVPPPR